MRKLCLATTVLLLAAMPALAADDGVDDATKSAVRNAISGQLTALDHEDGDKAESFAAQGIRDRFTSGPAFMAMVREHYGALLHARSTTFGAIEASPHGPLQTVTIIAADGTIWTAIYSFEQAGGAWVITGCSLQKLQGEQEI